MHGGHSSVFALGSEPGTRDGWSVGLHRTPNTPTAGSASCGCATAPWASRRPPISISIHDGRKLGHILDPRTGWPAEDLALAAATAPTAAEADALATAFFVLGAEAARALCDAHAHLGAILLPVGEDRPPVIMGRAATRSALDCELCVAKVGKNRRGSAAPMAVGSSLDRADQAVREGRLWRAKEILQGGMRSAGYDVVFFERLGVLLLRMGDLLEAGKFLFLSGRREPDCAQSFTT